MYNITIINNAIMWKGSAFQLKVRGQKICSNYIVNISKFKILFLSNCFHQCFSNSSIHQTNWSLLNIDCWAAHMVTNLVCLILALKCAWIFDMSVLRIIFQESFYQLQLLCKGSSLLCIFRYLYLYLFLLFNSNRHCAYNFGLIN